MGSRGRPRRGGSGSRRPGTSSRLTVEVHALLLYVFLPVVSVGVLAVATPELVPAWRATHVGGSRGTFTATKRTCTHGRNGTTCTSSGTFVSDDGRYAFEHVRIDKDAGDDGAITAVYVPGTHGVVYDPYGREWLPVGLLTIGAIGYLALGGAWLIRRR